MRLYYTETRYIFLKYQFSHPLWRRGNARNVSYCPLHGGHFPHRDSVDTPAFFVSWVTDCWFFGSSRNSYFSSFSHSPAPLKAFRCSLSAFPRTRSEPIPVLREQCASETEGRSLIHLERNAQLINPDQFQISPAASPEILHHTVWRT